MRIKKSVKILYMVKYNMGGSLWSRLIPLVRDDEDPNIWVGKNHRDDEYVKFEDKEYGEWTRKNGVICYDSSDYHYRVRIFEDKNRARDFLDGGMFTRESILKTIRA